MLASLHKAVIHLPNYSVTLWKSLSVTLSVLVNPFKEMSERFVVG
jgi:hypothetical protein